MVVDFEDVSTVGLESSPVAAALAGLRANEARYFMNKYKHEFTVDGGQREPGHTGLRQQDPEGRARHRVRRQATGDVTAFRWRTSRWTHVFYEDGLAVNVLYTIDDPKKRAVGFKLSEGMDVPAELEGKFKFARQKSKLAGTIRGSFFVIKGEY